MTTSGLATIREGTTDLLVPAEFCRSGPGTKTGAAFYNRQMEFSRDISVVLGRETFSEGDRVLDGLAATGARGVRLANECGVEVEVHLNDWNTTAVELIRRNVELNGQSNTVVHNRDLRGLLAEERFSHIDIDPFGTPVAFVDAAVQACEDGGMLAVTATDTAPLHGSYPKTCQRRYGAASMRCPFSHEVGLRILLGYIAREAAKHDTGCVPLLCYHADHYFRCYAGLRRGARRADDAVARLGYATFDEGSGARATFDQAEAGRGVRAGPLWTGRIIDRSAVGRLAVTDDLGTRRRCEKALGLWADEADAPPLYYTVDELATRTKRSPPRMGDLIETVTGHGFRASRTHFDPRGVKTDAPMDDMLRLFEESSGAK